METTIRFAEGIAERPGNVTGVVAVALGGSWARGEGYPNSDVDLGVYYRPDRPPAVGELRRLAQELDDWHPVSTYPPKLKRALIEKYLWEAGFSLEIARKPAARGDASYVSGCLFRGVACMVQALFAANERWFLNEKGSVGAVDSMPAKPATSSRSISSRCSSAKGAASSTTSLPSTSSWSALGSSRGRTVSPTCTTGSSAERSVPPPSPFRRIQMLGSQQESVSDELE